MATKQEYKPAPEPVVKLVEQITALDVEIEERQTRRKQLVDTVAQLVNEVGTYAAGSAQVTVKDGPRRLDKVAFLDAYPPEKYPAFYKHEPNVAAARDEIGKNNLDALYGAPGARQVVVK